MSVYFFFLHSPFLLISFSILHSLPSLALVFSFILWLAPAHSSLSSVCVLYPQVSQHAPPSPEYPRRWAQVSHFSAGPYGRTPDSLVTPRRERAGRGPRRRYFVIINWAAFMQRQRGRHLHLTLTLLKSQTLSLLPSYGGTDSLSTMKYSWGVCVGVCVCAQRICLLAEAVKVCHP